MNEMRFRTIAILTGVAVLIGIALLYRFAISDFVASREQLSYVIANKPWRPWARVIFSVIMGFLLIAGSIGFLKYKANKI